MTPKQREPHRKKRIIECAEFELQVMLEETKADMAAQLERVREMERAGELATIPRDDGSSQHGVGPR